MKTFNYTVEMKWAFNIEADNEETAKNAIEAYVKIMKFQNSDHTNDVKVTAYEKKTGKEAAAI